MTLKIFSMLVCLSFSACKQRTFSEVNGSITIWKPDDTSETIEVSPKGDEPYLQSGFRNAFAGALTEAARDATFGDQGLLGFMAPDTLKRLRSKSITPVEAIQTIWPVMDEEDLHLLYYIQQTSKKPFGPSNGMYRGDVFDEGNFRTRVWFSADSNRAEGFKPFSTLQELMNWQPWFEWQAREKKFVHRTSGASMRILDHLASIADSNGEIILYRGSDSDESKINYRPPSQDPYSGKLQDVALVFATPDRSAATKFANPYLNAAKFSINSLKQLAAGAKPLLYVGIEYDYVELAFVPTIDMKHPWFSRVKTECLKGSPTAEFPSCR